MPENQQGSQQPVSLEELEKQAEKILKQYGDPHNVENLLGLTELLAMKFYNAMNELKRRIKGQDEYINALITALASREHVALISPPGTAKSYAVRLLQQMIDGATLYTALFNPYLNYDQVFGPIDIAKLRQGQVVRKWGNIVRANLAFLDEGFKANPALLNTLLSWLNERVVYDAYSGKQIKVPLITAVIASNEVPTEENLRALWDRIAIRVYGKYLQSPEMLTEALYATLETRGKVPSKVLKLEDIVLFHKLLDRVLMPGHPFSKAVVENLTRLKNYDIVKLLRAMVIVPLFELRNQFGEDVLLSDRTIIAKMPRIWLAATLILLYSNIPSFSMLEALRRIHLYAAGDEDVASSVADYFKSRYGDLYELAVKLNKVMQRLIPLVDSIRSGRLPSNYDKIINSMKMLLEEVKRELISRFGSTTNGEPAEPTLQPNITTIADVKSFILHTIWSDYNELKDAVKEAEELANELKTRIRERKVTKSELLPANIVPS